MSTINLQLPNWLHDSLKSNQANQARKPASPINRTKFEKFLVADVAPEEKDKL
jgi:hypothetical protein